MLYIVVALKAEAQAYIDKYKLRKSKLAQYSMFYNDSLMLIVSGLGVINAARATQALINHYDITDKDIYLNVGICGASKEYKIGKLLEIGSVVYNTKPNVLQSNSPHVLHCLDQEATTDEFTLVDMESFGFYDAIIHSPAIKHYHIIKVVSDHFEPHTITKDMAKSLIFNVIDDINLILKTKLL